MSVRDTLIRSRGKRSYLKAIQSCGFGGLELVVNPENRSHFESLEANGRIFLNDVPVCASDTVSHTRSVQRKNTGFQQPVIRERKSSPLDCFP